MRFQFSFKHMEKSEALEQYAQSKIEAQVVKFVTKPIEVNVTFSTDKRQHMAACSLVGGDGFSINVDHSCEDMYGSIDRVIDKLGVQLKRKKDRLKNHKNRGGKNRFGQRDSKGNDFESAEIDADDIIKYEQAKKRMVGT